MARWLVRSRYIFLLTRVLHRFAATHPTSSSRGLHIPVMAARDRRGSHAQGAPMSAAFDARLGPHAEAPVKPHLNQPVDPRFALGILAVLALGLFYMAYSIRIGHFGRRRRADDDPALHSARRRVADRARLRIRQRLPRHRERGRHRHLHPRLAGAGRGCVVGVLESPRRAGFDRRGGLRHRLAAAGRAHSSGRLRRGLRDGVCAAHFRDHLEPGHLVARHSRFEFAHPDRFDRRRRRRQRAHPRPERHRRRGLGPGHQGRRGALVLAAVRLCPCRRCCCSR